MRTKQRQINWNDKLPEIFRTKRKSFGEKKWTVWASYLRKLKIKQIWIADSDGMAGSKESTMAILDVVNSAKKKYVYVVGSRRRMKTRKPYPRRITATEILLVPPKLAQKILVLGGLP